MVLKKGAPPPLEGHRDRPGVGELGVGELSVLDVVARHGVTAVVAWPRELNPEIRRARDVQRHEGGRARDEEDRNTTERLGGAETTQRHKAGAEPRGNCRAGCPH